MNRNVDITCARVPTHTYIHTIIIIIIIIIIILLKRYCYNQS
jgi:hypothetical protein